MTSDERPPLEPPSGPGAGRPTSSVASTLLFALGIVAIAFWDLGGRAMWHRDIPRFAVIAREMIVGGDWLVPHQHGVAYFNKPILFIWAVAAPSALFGDPTTWTLRLPSAIALVLMALSTARWARVRTGSVEIGRWAAVFVATTALTNELGRVGRPDMLAAAFGTIAAARLDLAMLGPGSRRDVWIAGLALGAGLVTKGPIVLLVPAALVLLPRAGASIRERARQARPFAVLAIAVVVAALWIVPVWLRAGDDFVKSLVVDQVKERALGRGNHLQGPFFYVTALTPLLLPWAPLTVGAAVAFCFRRVRERLGPATLVLATLAALLVLSAIPTKDPRYCLVLVPPLSIVGAQAASALCDCARRETRVRGHVVALRALVVLFALGTAYPMIVWPSAIPWLVPPAVVLLLAGVIGPHRLGRVKTSDAAEPATTAGALAAQWVTLLLILVACGSAIYWSIFARYLVHSAVQENEAVAKVLPSGVSIAIWIDDGLEPDDLYTSVERPIPVRDAATLPTRAAAPRLVVVCTKDALADVTKARPGESPAVLLKRPREPGRDRSSVLMVIEYGR